MHVHDANNLELQTSRIASIFNVAIDISQNATSDIDITNGETNWNCIFYLFRIHSSFV